MSQMAMEPLTYAYKERLAFIVFSLQIFRQVIRSAITQRFNTDLTTFKPFFSAYSRLASECDNYLHSSILRRNSAVFSNINNVWKKN